MKEVPIPPPVVLLGVPIHRVTMGQCLDWMEGQIEARRAGYLAIANMEFAAMASRDAELQRTLLEADLVVCDGAPLVWASRWMNGKVPERIAPPELVLAVCGRAEQRGWRLFFLGGGTDALGQAKARLLEKFPNLPVVGMESPAAGEETGVLVDRIRAAKPDALFVSMGSPAQERWIWSHFRKLGVPVCAGVGEAFSVIAAGASGLAPGSLPGLSWLCRIMRTPVHLVIPFLLNLWFFSRATARQKLALQQSCSGQAGDSELAVHHEDVIELSWSGRIDAAMVETMDLPEPTRDMPHVLLDMQKVTFIDSTGLGQITKLYRACVAVEGTLVLVAMPPVVQRMLAAVRLDKVFRHAPDKATAYSYMPGRTGTLLPFVGGFDDEFLIWSLQGDIRQENADTVFQQVSMPWEARPMALELALDMSQVEFIDSHGVSTLLRLYKMARSREGGRMSIHGAGPVVRNVLALARLDRVLGVV